MAEEKGAIFIKIDKWIWKSTLICVTILLIKRRIEIMYAKLVYPVRISAGVLAILAGLALADVVITGNVYDAVSSSPLPDALVTLQASDQRTRTDANGNYSLSVPDGQSVVIVAAQKGYYNESHGFSPGSGTVLDFAVPPVPHANDPDYALRTPQSCASCHPNQFAQWNGSAMSKGGTNAWVHDIYSGTGTPGGMGGFVYTRDSAFADTNPNTECASCHQPERWIETPFSRMEGPADSGYPSIGTMHGVSCETCHKIADVDVDKVNYPGIFPGAVEFTRPEGPAFAQVMYGVLGDTDFSIASLMRPSYNPQLVAETCAACHQDAADPEENHSFNGVISEPTYLEWAASPYADLNSSGYSSCVDCHMPAASNTQVCSLMDLGRPVGSTRDHNIRGTTPEFLENAAELVAQSRVVGGRLEVDVDVTNAYTGHHLPTGVTVRNMILLVEAYDPATGAPLAYLGDQVVHDLGGVGDPAQGYYAGLAGKFYAKVNRDAQGNGPTFFTDAAAITFDNRIPALETDSTSYAFALPGSGSYEIRTRLIYRRAFRFLVDAKQWTQDGHGNPLGDVTSPYFGHLMESTSETVSVCFADLTGDGVLNFFDVSAFLTSYSAMDPIADLNNDANFDFFDVSAFLSAFAAGCP